MKVPAGFISSKELSEWLRRSPRALARWRAEGKGPKFKRVGEGVGSRVFYSLHDLEQFFGATPQKVEHLDYNEEEDDEDEEKAA